MAEKTVTVPTPQIMAVVNTTPDSFSDGGDYLEPKRAIDRIGWLIDAGADLIDVGGESTRPDARPISEDVELARVIPVIASAVQRYSLPISVDTTKANVARRALEAGATIINDVSGGFADPEMLSVIADFDATYILGHWPRHLPWERQGRRSTGEVNTVIADLRCSVERAVNSGVSPARILVDPGIGFDKDAEFNWNILTHTHHITAALELPLVIGASRKRFLGALGGVGTSSMNPADRESATTALHALLAHIGRVDVLRTHNVAAARDAILVAQKWSLRLTAEPKLVCHG